MYMYMYMYTYIYIFVSQAGFGFRASGLWIVGVPFRTPLPSPKAQAVNLKP